MKEDPAGKTTLKKPSLIRVKRQKVLCTEGSILYSGKSEAKENLSGCCFVNTNLLEERAQVLLSVKELSKLPDNSPNIIKKSNIDRYVERPSAPFCDENNSILNDFYYTGFQHIIHL